MSEQEAIALLKAGDLTGLEWLVERYYFQAVRASDLIVRDVGLAEDIVQTAFLHASEKIGQLSSDRFAPWFFKIVVNASIKSAGRQKRQVSLESRSEDETSFLAEWLVDLRPSVEELVETAELRRDIWSALSRLTTRQRAAVVLKYYLDMSEIEISQELRAPQSTIKWLLYTARQKLQNLLRLPDISAPPFEPGSAYDRPDIQEKE